MDYLSTHHRHPVSQGGANQSWNLIDVPRDPHNSWHTLIGNAPAIYVPKQFSRYCPHYTFMLMGNPQHISTLVPVEGFSKKNSKLRTAWQHLFKGLSMEEIVFQVNSTWIDPRFKLAAYPRSVYWRDMWKYISTTHPGVKIFLSEQHPTEYITT